MLTFSLKGNVAGRKCAARPGEGAWYFARSIEARCVSIGLFVDCLPD